MGPSSKALLLTGVGLKLLDSAVADSEGQLRHSKKSKAGASVTGDDDDDEDPSSTTIAPLPQYHLVKSGHECASDDTYLATVNSLEECYQQVRNHGGKHFVYGARGDDARQCRREDTTGLDACAEGLRERASMDFYTVDNNVEGAELVKPKATCKSNEDFLGNFPSLAACLGAVRAAGGRFFAYGHGVEDGRCFRESTGMQTCPEGWTASESQDFYKVTDPPAGVELIRANTQCRSGEVYVGNLETLEQCMEGVRALGGRYFLYGKRKNAGLCYREDTVRATCPEGWATDEYDFYQVTSTGEGRAIVLKAQHQCLAPVNDLGKQPSVNACMVAVKAVGGTYFSYDRTHKFNENTEGGCRWVQTDSDDCPEGFQGNGFMDFYKILEAGETGSFITKVKSDRTCHAHTDQLGLLPDPEACAEAVLNAGGRYYNYWKDKQDGQCEIVRTSSEDCPEGFIEQPGDFYKVELVPKSQIMMGKLMLYGGAAAGALIVVLIAFKLKRILVPGSTPPPLLRDGEELMSDGGAQWAGSSAMQPGAQARDMQFNQFRQF